MMEPSSAPLLDDDTIPFGEENEDKTKLKHPFVTAFHVGFRLLAILSYMLCSWFSDSYITSFVFIVLFLCMDFWTVKNITGRLMVGLRWWNYIDDDGKSHWVFESRKGPSQNRIHPSEARIFWAALFTGPILWSVFFLVALFGAKLKWLLLICIALSLNVANLYGYLKCRFGQGSQGLGKSVSEMASGFFRKQVIENMTSMMSRTSSSQPTNTPSAQTNVV